MKKAASCALLLLTVVSGFGLSTRGRADEGTPGVLSLPETVAWKEIVWSNDDSSPVISVNLIDKNRWRIEAKNSAKPKVLVVVFDGSKLAASNPKAPVSLDPRPTMGSIFDELARGSVVGVERRDGHNCWHISIRRTGLAEDVWVDILTRFPVYLEGTLADGRHVRGSYTLLNLDLEGDGARYFGAGSTAPLFSPSLVP